MAKLNIVQYGEEILREKARPVETITERTKTLLDDMVETMRSADGCGLAGPQVGILRRVCVIEVEPGKVIELINPKIIAMAGEQREVEGCLSIPGRNDTTVRPMYVTVKALNRNGEEITVNGQGLLARALCHEIDHLDGVLFIDRTVKKSGKK